MGAVTGAILAGKKVGQKLLRKYRLATGVRGKDIKSVKPMSGKIPPYIGAGGKDPGKRAKIVKTHFSLKRSDKISKAVKDIKEGKKTLKDMEATGQAQELKGYKGRRSGIWHKKGFN